MGIEVVFGKAEFKDAHTLEIFLDGEQSRRVTAAHIFIATGAKAFIPPIVGLKDIHYLTNESLFEIDNLPEHLLIIGGPIGIEMSQAFVNLGSKVTVIDKADRIMQNDDAELVEILQQSLIDQNVEFKLGCSINKIQNSGKKLKY